MYVVAASCAFDITVLPVPVSHRIHHAWRMAHCSVRPSLHVAGRAIVLAAQAVTFSAVLWMLVAGPGFLTARDSLVASEMVRTAHQASR